MNKSNFFKALFWILNAAIFGFVCLMILRVGFTITEATRISLYMILGLAAPLIIIAAIFTTIAVFVYKDAPKRGMDRWMWMTIAVFVPNLIGLIIYFIVRNSNNAKCLNCGKSIKSEFEVCPYCSTPLKSHCPKCGRQVLPGWQVCPHCRHDLT